MLRIRPFQRVASYRRAEIQARGNRRGLWGGCVPPAPPGPTHTADLTIVKADSPDPVAVDAALTYTLTVSNQGLAPAAEVLVTDSITAGVPASLTSFTASQGTCSVPTPGVATVFCVLGSLDVAQSATITITVTPLGVGQLTNSATINSLTPDANVANNSTSATTTVMGGARPPPPPPPSPPPPPPPPPPRL